MSGAFPARARRRHEPQLVSASVHQMVADQAAASAALSKRQHPFGARFEAASFLHSALSKLVVERSREAEVVLGVEPREAYLFARTFTHHPDQRRDEDFLKHCGAVLAERRNLLGQEKEKAAGSSAKNCAPANAAAPVSGDARLNALVACRDAAGSDSQMARDLGRPQSTVWRWLHEARQMPAEYVLTAERLYGVSRHDLRPDIYPRDYPPAPKSERSADDSHRLSAVSQ